MAIVNKMLALYLVFFCFADFGLFFMPCFCAIKYKLFFILLDGFKAKFWFRHVSVYCLCSDNGQLPAKCVFAVSVDRNFFGFTPSLPA